MAERVKKTGRVDWREWLILLGFVLSVALVGVFVARSVHVVRQLPQDETIRPWMTVPYVAHSYRVSPSLLLQALGLPARPHDRRPISSIARAQHRPLQDVIADLQRAIVQARSSSAPSPSPPGRAP
jgi:hypothetical protein